MCARTCPRGVVVGEGGADYYATWQVPPSQTLLAFNGDLVGLCCLTQPVVSVFSDMQVCGVFRLLLFLLMAYTRD